MTPENLPKPLPPHRGRVATLDILHQPVATHVISDITTAHLGRRGNVPQGLPFRIFRAIPRTKPPIGGFPILYMLDGTAAFDYLTPALLESVPDLVVIGLGYGGDAQFARNDRVFDYTPPKVPAGAPFPDPAHGDRLAGGAEGFRDALIGPLRTIVENGLSINPARRSLWGHSLGGLCTLFTALTRPAAFARYSPTSPSIWWNPEQMFGLLDQMQVDPAHPIRVHLSVGDHEQRTGSDGPPPALPPPLTVDMMDRLARTPGITLTRHIYAGAVHIATLPASLPTALRLAAD